LIAVIDYGMGNLRSVEKALQVSGAKTKVTSGARDIARASKIVFPGVGSFGAAMKELKKLRLVEPIKDAIAEGKPFLGLCLGMQLLFEKSEESPGVWGLGVLRGEVKRFNFRRNPSRPLRKSETLGMKFPVGNFKVPHMGWNSIVHSPWPIVHGKKILRGVAKGAYMYFVHSYYVRPRDKGVILTTTDYGIKFASGVAKDNVFGLQFHPEKSQAVGLGILRNFVELKNRTVTPQKRKMALE